LRGAVIGCVIFIPVGSDAGVKEKRYFYTVTFISGNKTLLPFLSPAKGWIRKMAYVPN
jgi:hypothetical protein